MISADPFMQGKTLTPPATVELRGPADPDNFRVKVGRYGDRFYTDPLPGCLIATASDAVWPSVSTVKKASGSDWSFVALKRVSEAMSSAPYNKLAEWKPADRYEGLKAVNKTGLGAAGRRGTNVHLMAEARLYGLPCPVTDGNPGYEYRAAVDQFFDTYQPTLVAAEFVCIHRTLNEVGYGGTADAIIEIDGRRYLIDWKSRGADSDHGAYPEEGAQVAAYAGAEYIITANGRQPVPALDGGLIVSIKPDGCRVYPVDLDKGFAHWTALHAWWTARQNERDAVGRQWPARSATDVPVDEGYRAMIAAAQAINPPAPALTFDEYVMSNPATLTVVDARNQLATTPNQGADLTKGFDALWAATRGRYDLLDPVSRAWIAELSSRATRASLSFHTVTNRTERTYQIARGLIALAGAENDSDEILRALLAVVIGDVALFPAIHPGHTLGSLDHTQATQWADLVDALNGDRLTSYVDGDGVLRYRVAA